MDRDIVMEKFFVKIAEHEPKSRLNLVIVNTYGLPFALEQWPNKGRTGGTGHFREEMEINSVLSAI